MNDAEGANMKPMTMTVKNFFKADNADTCPITCYFTKWVSPDGCSDDLYKSEKITMNPNQAGDDYTISGKTDDKEGYSNNFCVKCSNGYKSNMKSFKYAQKNICESASSLS